MELPVSNDSTRDRDMMILKSRWFGCPTAMGSSTLAKRMPRLCSLAEIIGFW